MVCLVFGEQRAPRITTSGRNAVESERKWTHYTHFSGVEIAWSDFIIWHRVRPYALHTFPLAIYQSMSRGCSPVLRELLCCNPLRRVGKSSMKWVRGVSVSATITFISRFGNWTTMLLEIMTLAGEALQTSTVFWTFQSSSSLRRWFNDPTEPLRQQAGWFRQLSPRQFTPKRIIGENRRSSD